MVDPAGSVPWSELPSCSESTGTETSRIAAIAASERIFGRRATNADQRCHPPASTAASGPLFLSERRSLRLSTRNFWNPSSDGSNVSEAVIVIITVSAAEIPTPLRNENPSTSIPSNAIHTVNPANSTARPEVLIEEMIESSTLIPCLRFCLLLVTMNSA